jgi:transcriptional regulator
VYSFSYYIEKDRARVLSFMQANPFAMLIGSNNHTPAATQVPFFIDEVDGELILTSHIMKNTDHHKAFVQNPESLVVFTGPHTYVSASLYTHAPSASTWNYISVHARGQLQFMDETGLRNILRRTTDYFENDPHSKAAYDKLPDEYISKLLPAIVGIEIKVTTLDNVFKLSQNRDAASYDNIIQHLSTQDAQAQAIAREMQARKKDNPVK